MKALNWAFMLGAFTQGLIAQECDTLVEWPAREQRWWDDFIAQTEGWSKAPEWDERLWLIQCHSASQLAAINIRLEAAEARNDVHLADSIQALRSEQELLRTARNAQFFGITPQEWWPALSEILEPKRPDVFHFGIHDRMKCVVCYPAEKQAP